LSDTASPHSFVGFIDHNIGVSSALGSYFGAFGTVEFSLIKLFALVLGEDPKESTPLAFSILGQLQSLSLRMDVIERATAASSLSAEHKALINDLVADARVLNTRRNKYAHAAYEMNMGTLDVTMLPYFSDGAKPATKKAPEHLSEQTIRDDLTAIRRWVKKGAESLLGPIIPL
jgi:hypothetical protein